jgi:hypothetical protein
MQELLEEVVVSATPVLHLMKLPYAACIDDSGLQNNAVLPKLEGC